MITILVAGYAYIIWLFTGNNPLQHLGIETMFFAMLELAVEAFFIIFLATLIVKFSEINNDNRN